jgi:hypothetical protein
MDVPLYSSKFSRKDYTIHQHLLCLCIKEIQRQSYRDFAEFLDDFNGPQEDLGLKQVPHFTTLQKFLMRFPPGWYKMIHKRLICLIKSNVNVVVDGTGLMQTSASYSYIKRIKRRIKIRDYFKVILAVDSDHGYILSYQGVHGNRHESPCFIPLLEDIPQELGDICGDKGFDSEKNQRYVTKHSKGCSYLDVRDRPKRGKCRKRVYRQKHEHR